MYPKMSANEVILTPVVSVISLKEMLLTDKPMIVELMKTAQLLDRGDKKLVPVFSDTHQSSPLNWKAIAGAECEEIEDWFVLMLLRSEPIITLLHLQQYYFLP